MKKLKIMPNKNPELGKRNYLTFNKNLYKIPDEFLVEAIKDKVN